MSIDPWKIAPVLESIAGVLTGPEDLPAFIEVLEQTDWPEVFARVAEMRARRLAKLEASYAHLPPATCSECGRAFFGEDADQLLPIPGTPSSRLYCDECRPAMVENYRRTCALCHNDYMNRTPLGNCVNLCKGCWTEARAREAHRVAAHNERARGLSLPATLHLAEWLTAIEAFQGMCAYCGQVPFNEMDHYFPLSAGGGTCSDNVLPICQGCNSKKGRGLPSEQRMRRRFPAGTFERIEAYFASLTTGTE